MKIVLAALSAPAQLNGVSRHALNLARALLCQSSPESVHVLAGAWQKKMYREALPTGDPRLHVHWVPLADANWSRLVWYFRDLPQIAEQLEADIVHLAYPAPIATGAFPCPTVLTLHDLYPFDIPRNFGWMKAAFARYTMRSCLSQVGSIACVSVSTRARLERWMPHLASRAVVIPNVVEQASPTVHATGLTQLAGRSFILCVAQHRSNKNVPLAVQIFENLIRERVLASNSRLVIVGIPGPETRRIHHEIRRFGLGAKVHLYSGLSEAELRWCYENCAVLLVPSSIEGFGLPMVEGLQAGCRIVCSDIPAFREVAGAGCHFVGRTGDPIAAYTEAIRETLALSRPAPSSFPDFSPCAVGRRYVCLYESLTCPRLTEFDMLRQPEPMEATPPHASRG